MKIYAEYVRGHDGESFIKEWNCCHPSGHFGKVIERHVRGFLRSLFFEQDGRKHRLPSDGPAVIFYDEHGCVTWEMYYLHGTVVDCGETFAYL